jgi:hypothetical protein
MKLSYSEDAMIKTILSSWQNNMDGQTNELKKSFECRYCGKEFRKESTLAAHLCENKRRWQQEKETGVQWGLKAYLRFYELTQGSAKLKSYEDFVTSPYYIAFVKYGRHSVAIRNINFSSFTDWLLKNNKKLDQWTKDIFYSEWMLDYMKKEAPQDALERALMEMQKYAEEHPELRNGFTDYFKYANTNRILHHISTGRISPWIVYNCESGVAFLENLDETQLSMVMQYIDPDFWQRKLHDYMADTEWCKLVLKEAGL